MALKTPVEAHGVTTPDEYKALQRKYISRSRKIARVADVNPEVKLDGDALRVKCECGNYPIVHPQWALACCLECGLIYQNLVVPAEYI